MGNDIFRFKKMNIKRQLTLIRQMLYLLATVRNGKIRQTAEENGIKTSNLSALLKELETDSGIVLLNRKSDGVEPTAAGKVIYELAEEFEKTIDKLQKIQSNIPDQDKVCFYKPLNLDFNFSKYSESAKIYLVDQFEKCDVAILEYCPSKGVLKEVETRVVIESNQMTLNYWVVCKDKANKAAYCFYKFLVVSMM